MLFWASMNRITAAIEANSTPLCRVVRAASSAVISIVLPITGGSAPRIPLAPDFRRGWDPAGVVCVTVGAGCGEPAAGEEGGAAGGDAGGAGGAHDFAGFDAGALGGGEGPAGAGDGGSPVGGKGFGGG